MNNNAQFWIGLAQNLLMQAPIVLVAGLALVFCFARWRQMPKACLLGSLGFGLVILRTVLASSLQLLIPRMLGGNHQLMVTFFTVSGVVWSVVSAVAYGLLAAALFADRGTAPSAEARLRI
jgi:hypothetical protein